MKVDRRKSAVTVMSLVAAMLGTARGADLVIRVPGALSQQDGYYRLDYSPPAGSPAANTTFKPSEISETIDFSRGLPGTKYDFYLYYSNSSISDWLTWTASITTAPDPPSKLAIDVKSGTTALVGWKPPVLGSHSGFKLKLIPLSELGKSVRNLVVRETSSTLKDLSPGATYEIQMFSMFENKESQAYISTNFTSKPNTPGRFIVWFRNETTLLVLWQPPYPAGFYTDYKVSIKPEDALTPRPSCPRRASLRAPPRPPSTVSSPAGPTTSAWRRSPRARSPTPPRPSTAPYPSEIGRASCRERV